MPTVFTHAVVGLGLAKAYTPRPMPPLYWIAAAGLAMLPDLDIVAFWFGIPYGARFGHRGFSHSLFCAALVSLFSSLLTFERVGMTWWSLWGFYFLCMGSHGLLDAFTDGGKGIALFSPLDDGRYFFPWQPIRVSPIGMGFLSLWGLRALGSEILWVWLPVGCLVGAITWHRAMAP